MRVRDAYIALHEACDRSLLKNLTTYYKMNVYMSIFMAVLFLVLTPGVLLSFPPGGSKLAVAATHGVIFALVYSLAKDTVMDFTSSM
jgi:hypothetical protein